MCLNVLVHDKETHCCRPQVGGGWHSEAANGGVPCSPHDQEAKEEEEGTGIPQSPSGYAPMTLGPSPCPVGSTF
jgi:hypothetical protein